MAHWPWRTDGLCQQADEICIPNIELLVDFVALRMAERKNLRMKRGLKWDRGRPAPIPFSIPRHDHPRFLYRVYERAA